MRLLPSILFLSVYNIQYALLSLHGHLLIFLLLFVGQQLSLLIILVVCAYLET